MFFNLTHYSFHVKVFGLLNAGIRKVAYESILLIYMKTYEYFEKKKMRKILVRSV